MKASGPPFVILLPALLLCLTRQATGQTETPDWLLRAHEHQNFLGYDRPVDTRTEPATHNSFTSDWNITSRSQFEVKTAQQYNMTNQLKCLGVRRLELDPHYIEELQIGDDIDSAIHLCHIRPSTASIISTFCGTFTWEYCEGVGIFDYGADTGCRNDSSTLTQGFEEIAAWLLDDQNKMEILGIKLDSFVDGAADRVSAIAADVFGVETIFSPAHLEAFRNSTNGTGWPTPAQLLDEGTRLMIVGEEPSELVFDINNDPNEVIISPENFNDATCNDVLGLPEPSWTYLQGNVEEFSAAFSSERFGTVTIFEEVPDPDEAVTEENAPKAMLCGLTPAFDRMNASLLNSTIWSWSEGRPKVGFQRPRAAIVSAADGRWTDTGVSSKHPYACRQKDDRNSWNVIAKRGKFSEATHECECLGEGYILGAPRTKKENYELQLAMEAVGVQTVWIAHTSKGDLGGSSACWAREGGPEYCVKEFDDTCSAVGPEPSETVDGLLPLPEDISAFLSFLP
ncbi:unnamed protein product [Pylaiella littoralis]